jgi:hypothetical protein
MAGETDAAPLPAHRWFVLRIGRHPMQVGDGEMVIAGMKRKVVPGA